MRAILDAYLSSQEETVFGEFLEKLAVHVMGAVATHAINPALPALMAGHTGLMCDNLANAGAQIKAGKVRALAVTTAKRSAFVPELPTLAEPDARLKDFDPDTWFGIMAPAEIPKDALDKLHAAIVKTMDTAELKALFTRMGAEPGGNTAQQFAAFIERERAKYARIVKLSGAKVD